MSKYISYAQAGVDIMAGDDAVDQMRTHVKSTQGTRVIANGDGFAGLFRLDYDKELFRKNYKKPVLVSCTDGVGSKVQVASMMRKYNTVGIDLVAMSVNDMLVHGAEPLFFLDYIAVHKLAPYIIAQMVMGVAEGCKQADCALLGGETAEMPDTYKEDDFDMAGFAVGVVEHDKIIDGKNVRKGDVLLGLASSGLHSNGYALARHVCFKSAKLKVTDTVEELDGRMIGDVLLEPTRVYVKSIMKLLSHYKIKKVVHGMAHITGSGLEGNVPRMLPKNCDAVIKKDSWPRHKIFDFIQKAGPVEDAEMFRVFNMGIGYVLMVAEDFAKPIAELLKSYGEKVYRIGRITSGTGKVILK